LLHVIDHISNRMIKRLLENFKIIVSEIIGIVGGFIWSYKTNFNDLEPLILLVGSIIAFILSLIFRLYLKEDIEESKLKLTKDSFIFEFKEISKAIKEQSEIFLNKSNELKDFTKQEFELEIISNLKDANSRISKYNQQDLQIVFPDKLKHILNVFENIRNVDLQITKYEKELHSSLNKINNDKFQNTLA